MPLGIHTVDSEPRLYGNFFFFFPEANALLFSGTGICSLPAM